jgi:predicted nucleotidyltransferase
MREVTEDLIEQAVKLLHQAAPEATIILFGSWARGEAGERSDADFLVVEPEVRARRREMVRLRDVLRPLRIPVDILVVSRKNYEAWRDRPGTLIREVAREGKVCHGAA